MMGINHATTGLMAGVGLAVLNPHAPLSVRLLGIGICGGAALLSDFDHKQSKVAHSLGWLTRFIAGIVDDVSLSIYHATRTGADSPNREGGHRTFTHTIPGCLLFGAMTAADTVGSETLATWMELPPWAGPVPGAVGLALLFGLMVTALPAWFITLVKVSAEAVPYMHLRLTHRDVGFIMTLLGGLTSWWVMVQHPGWWWYWGVSVFVGSLAHCVGDCFTNSGDPLFWPFPIQGQRWYKVRTPATFSTGKDTEKTMVTPILSCALAVSIGLATGVLQVLVTAAAAAIRG